ncbi:MAG: hypothetical protein AAF480_08580, partial [Actinomycetota bacterium]
LLRVDRTGLATSASADFGWIPPEFGRMWLFDTDRGVVMATAESFVGSDALEEALALADTVVPSLHLVAMPDGAAASPLTDLILEGEPSGDGALAAAGTEVISDALDTPLSLTVPVDVAMVDELPGLIGFGVPGATRGENVLTAVFESTGVPGPTPEDPPTPLPDDIGSYVEAIAGIEILDSGVDRTSGVDAPWWDLTVADGATDTFECFFGDCVALLAHDTFGAIIAGDEWRFRLWSIPEPDGRVFALTQATPDRFEDFAAFSGDVLTGLRVLPVPAELEPVDPFDLGGIESAPELEPGRYFADLLPMPFAIEIDRPLGLDIALPSFIGLTSGQGSGLSFQGLAVLEPVNGLADPADIGGPDGPPVSWVPVPDDLVTWVDQIPQLEVVDSGERTISGFDAPWVDVAVVGVADRRGDCGMACLVLFDFAFGPWVATEESPQRIHTVRHPAGTIFVILEAATAEFPEWVAEAQSLIDGIELGG